MSGGLACVGGALAVAAVATRPLLWTPGSLPRYAGPGAVLADADRDLNIWILAWAARAVLTDPAHLFDGNIFFPARNTLAGSESMLAHLPVTAAVWAATHDATWVLKAEMVWCLVATGLAVFLVIRFHTGTAWAGAIAAAAVALQPGQVNPFGVARGLGAQPQYLGFQYAPLALLALGWWASRGAPAAAIGFALGLALQALACFYHGYYAFLTVPFYGATLLWSRRSSMALLGLALALAGGAGLVLPVARYYLEARAGGVVQTPDPRVVAVFSLKDPVWGACWIGPVAVGLGVIGAIAAATGSRPLPAFERAGWVLAAAALVLALGPTLDLPGEIHIPLPHRVLARFVPGFAMVRGPIRALAFTALGLALAGAGALARQGSAWPRGVRLTAAVLGVGAALAWLARGGVPLEPAPLGRDLPPVYRWLAAQPRDGAVLEVPGAAAEEDLAGLSQEARYMLYSTVHWHPLVNGYTAYPPAWGALAKSLARRLPDAEALQVLVNVADQLRWVVVHRRLLSPAARAAWEVAGRAGLREVARFGEDVVYRVERAASASWRPAADGAPEPTTLEGTPTAPLPAACRRGAIEVRFPEAMVVSPGVEALPVAVTNVSPCAWPGLAVRSEGLVVLTTEWIAGFSPGKPPAITSRLPHDLHPGETVATDAVVLAPHEPGEYRLRVLLVQRGVPGVLASAEAPVRISAWRTE